MHAMDEEYSNMNLMSSNRRHDGLANESSASQVTVNRELIGNQPRGVDKIKQAVVDYVASLLMPLYKARKVAKESYKSNNEENNHQGQLYLSFINLFW
ncbi:hypothetical protein HanRHA438_Chr09g0408441 [Helianthus annuus]|uniref:Uncharacterized protein n=1 Tax=Helianthus annuus TaxID=4232 RepID=A0A9K3N957_HELAN|nr:hypothetical protein HanXRQr2_Chr09g0396621 [Helianthus annuus]KAJ0526640.1 hypothetical protein HanHA300_Chr09g0325451 [Helianthus annuus]KAJ0535150.1 hypothetical protein HanIR_Chr09g0427581 [Helianthus annuus]KAJ0543035.1 hypothetical protein HanHA89_Chr09g0346381 [Helianthus annuus]KAJ0708089.1 hypothetical protein HanLR1_Chr09g0325701 [Helianthus annuus]